jgi:hypothetical protein
VRKTGAKDGIEELAASIASHGLLQSLVVRKAKGDKYEIIAGRRRFAAHAVNLVQSRADRPDSDRYTHGAQLTESLALDMSTWFVPGAENYFGRINRTEILAAIDEARGNHAPALDKLKKAELAARAQDLIANSGWLPALLRTAAKAA